LPPYLGIVHLLHEHTARFDPVASSFGTTISATRISREAACVRDSQTQHAIGTRQRKLSSP
jgi:hypothetical protein